MPITAAELVVKVGADTGDAEGGLKSFSSKMKGFASSAGALGGLISATIGAPLIGIGVSAVKTAATFERSMNVLGQVSGATGKQLQEMSDQALQLGADTVFSSNEAASGMVELAKAGLSTSQVMKAIPGVMDLAAAGAIGVEEAANLTAATLNTFGLEASKSAEVADVLAAAANASAADITDLAFGVQNAGSIFASSGQSVQTLATMMALLANNGLNASDAATSLKTMTLRLTAPTAQAAKEMKKLGINVFNTDGSMRDYHDIIVDLSKASSGLSDEQRSMAFNVIFGADSMRAANILAKEGAKGYEDMAAAVNQQGAAAAMANAQNSGLSGAMEQISGSIESLMTKLALPFLPAISGWLSGLTDFVNGLGTLSPAVTNATLAFLGFAAALGVALLAVAGLATVIGTLTATTVIGGMTVSIGLVALAVIGLAAAVAGLWVAWQTNWGNIQGLTQTAITAMTPWFTTLTTFLTGLATAAASAATEIGKIVATSFDKANFPTFDEMFKDVLSGNFSGLTNKLQKALDSLVLNLKLNLDINTKIAGAQKQLNSAFDTVINNINFTGAANTLTNKMKQLTTAINTVDLTGINWLDVLNRILINPLKAAVGAIAWVFSSDKFGRLVTAVSNAIATINWGDLGGAFLGLYNAVVRQIGIVVNDMISDLTPLFFLLGLAIRPLAVAIGEQFNSLVNTLTAAIFLLGLAFRPIAVTIGGIINTVIVAIGTAVAVLSSVFSTVVSTLSSVFSTLQAVFGGIVSFFAAIPGFLAGIQAAFSNFSLVGLIGGYLKGIAALTNGLANAIRSVDWVAFGAMLANGLIAVVTGGFSVFFTTLKTLWAGLVTAFGAAVQANLIASQVAGQVASAFPGFIGQLISGLVQAFMGSGLLGAFANLFGAIGSAIGGYVTGVLTTVWQAISTWFGTLGSLPAVQSIVTVFTAISSLGTSLASFSTTISAFVWPAALTTFAWSTYVSALNWVTYVSSLAWDSFVGALSWASWVSSLSWSSFVSSLSWNSFISIFSWNSYIPELSWTSWINHLNWGDFISFLNFGGSGSSPGTGDPSGKADPVPPSGTISSVGGGEVAVAGMFGGGGGGVSVIIQNVTVNNGMDVEQLVATIARRLQQKMRL